MSDLPISSVVSVVITRETIFPTRKGFGVMLIVTSENTGGLDANNRTVSYRSIDEVAADWPSSSEVYKAATAAFSQKPSAPSIKIGWRDDAEDVIDELNLIVAADNDWYGLAFTSEMRDNADVLLIAAWVEARIKLYGTATNDVDTLTLSNITNVSHLLKESGYDRTFTFYHPDALLYPEVAALSRAFTVNFEQPNSTMTLKFKRLIEITPVDLSSGDLQVVTGFVPGLGLDPAAGHFANTYVEIGGARFMVEGNMASGEFFDTMHFVDWLQSAIQTQVLGSLSSIDTKIPYTNVGTQKLVESVDLVLQQGINNGGLASDVDPDTGEALQEYAITVQRVEDVPPSQRANRIAPDISFEGRLAGAFHYSSVRGKVVV